MRLVTWNMARGFRPKGRDRDPWEVLSALSPDIALLQEASPLPQGFGGYYHFNRSRSHWGTAVWSRFELSSVDRLPGIDDEELRKGLPAVDGYFAGALVDVPGFGEVVAISVHAYPSKVGEDYLDGLDSKELVTPPQKAVWPGDILWWMTRRLPDGERPAILGGDWNTARRIDEVYGPRGNRGFFERMLKTGWYEALGKFHDSEVRTYFIGEKAPYQVDHVFLSEGLYHSLEQGFVDSSPEILLASDHAPIVFELQP